MSSNTWQDAVELYISTLGPAERAGFQAPASPEDCMSLLTATRRRKTKLTRMLDLLKPAIDPLKRFEGAIDVVVQVNAGIASPIWGPLRIVITLAVDHFRTLESVAMIIHRIISSLQRFSKYEELFRTNMLVQEAIGALYCDYIDFCVRVTRFYSTSSFKSLFSSFEKDFREVFESIQHHSQNVDWAANAAHIAETQREMEKAASIRKVHERGNIQRWLAPPAVQDDLQRHLDEYMPNSCDWILASNKYQAWASMSDELPHSPLLALHGIPGIGKSTTAAFLINHLASQGCKVMYFFFKAHDGEKRSTIGIFRAILSQLLRLDKSLYQHVEPLYQESGRAIADSLVEVEVALSNVLRQTLFRPILLVLDALDEASEPRRIVDWVTTYTTAMNRPLRVLCTTRSLQTITVPGSSTWSTIKLGHIHDDSIRQYIITRVNANPMICRTSLRQEVTDSVVSAANGLWLFARLMMDDIDRHPSVGQIQRRLNSHLPRGITELYTQLMRTHEAALSAIEMTLAQQLQLWLESTGFSSTAEDSFQYKMLALVLQYGNDGEAVFDPISLASRICGPLIEVRGNASSPDCSESPEVGYELDFIHHTARQYLKESKQRSVSDLPQILRPQRLRQLHHAMLAVWYFTECKEPEDILHTLRSNTSTSANSMRCYFEMAYALWGALQLDQFPEMGDDQEAAEAAQMLRKISGFISSSACLRWIEIAIIINYQSKWPHLLWRIMDTWKGAKKVDARHFDPYVKFSAARLRFSQHYAVVLTITGMSSRDTPQDLLSAAHTTFRGDELAQKILKIGRKWQPFTSIDWVQGITDFSQDL